ncbi:MAG: orotidine-5'-phosphate decarboxylase [Acidobacteriaceae bacterium]
MIIVALDFADASSALHLVDRLGDHADFYKVGLQLFTAAGASVIEDLKKRGKRVFLDLKFHDIPNTVAGAVQSASRYGVDMLTVHASGGRAMVEAAVEAASRAEQSPLVLAVTVLTSMDAAALRDVNVTVDAAHQVIALAKLAESAGCRGLVCSPEEIKAVREQVSRTMRIVVPGIRPAGASAHDQARTATPQTAIASGADYLVIGRPITAAPDPLAALASIKRDIST